MLYEIINQKVLSYETEREKPALYVITGFDDFGINTGIPSLLSDDFLNFPIYLDENLNAKLYTQIMSCTQKKESYWCYSAQYIFFERQFINTFFNVIHVRNPIYRKLLPFNLNSVSDDVLSFFESDEVETSTEEKLSQITNSITDLRLINGILYYIPDEEIKSDFFDIPISAEIKNESQNKIFHTLSDDDETWILLLQLLSESKKDVDISLSISSLYLKEELSDHCKLLNSLFDNDIRIGDQPQIKKGNEIFRNEALLKLKEYWGYSSFRDFDIYQGIRDYNAVVTTKSCSQLDVIDDILEESQKAIKGTDYRDIFVTAPTGTGKSLIFQIPSLLLADEGYVTLVISPLIGLMNDQVYSLEKKGVRTAATINSSITPNEKQEIIQRVQDGIISILYLSPESLLSRSDISMLIGERKIGLLVVDEAHIVTTWGKAFRPDYWYLGNYVQKLRKQQSFPIATFTATAIYKGFEDMYSETRDSLSLRDPITYFGVVPRTDIDISFMNKSEDEIKFKAFEYNKEKFRVCVGRLEEYKGLGKKVLVYFPFVSLINDFNLYLMTYEHRLNEDDIVSFFGSMKDSDKNQSFERFRSNKSRIMLATKAFGMGIDIPDIDIVYHFAPTGNVCDYVQEIGRAARDTEIQGLASFDYLPKDFSYVNRLHGISTIHTFQIIEVLRKIYEIGRQNNDRRNLLINSEDFLHIFSNSKQNTDKEFEDNDRKLKTALLIIEKDFIQKLGYSPIVARPRNLFTHAWFRIKNESEREDILANLKNYQIEDSGLIRIDLKAIWEVSFREESFASFKYKFYTDQTILNLPHKNALIPVFSIIINDWKLGNDESKRNTYQLLDTIINFCNTWNQKGKYFKERDLESYLAVHYPFYKDDEYSTIAAAIMTFLSSMSKVRNTFSGNFLTQRENLGYRFQNTGYSDIRYQIQEVVALIESSTNLSRTGKASLYLDQTDKNKNKNSRIFSILGLLDTARLLSYQVVGGENPEIFLRINSYNQIYRSINSRSTYRNIILENVKKRHTISVQFLDYLFKNIKDDSECFWKNIENYFLGILPDDLIVEPVDGEEELTARVSK